MKGGLVILLGMFLISLVSAAPTISDITLEPGQPIVSGDVKICANITDSLSSVAIVRVNLQSDNPLWNWGLVMSQENGLYCRTLSPILMNASDGKTISYHISARNLLNELTTSSTSYFTYSDLVVVVPPPSPEEDDEDDERDDDDDVLLLKKICEPSWKCGEWSPCFRGLIRRRCYDRNACSSSYNRPNEVADCGTNGKTFVKEADHSVFYIGSFFTIVLLIVLLIVVFRI